MKCLPPICLVALDTIEMYLDILLTAPVPINSVGFPCTFKRWIRIAL